MTDRMDIFLSGMEKAKNSLHKESSRINLKASTPEQILQHFLDLGYSQADAEKCVKAMSTFDSSLKKQREDSKILTLDKATQDQQVAYDFMMDFILNVKPTTASDFRSRFRLLKGYPGVGKTTIIQRVLEDLAVKEGAFLSIASVAPTNKATRVLRHMAAPLTVTPHISTFQSLLGIGVSAAGEELKSAKINRSKLDKIDVLVIDEVSILSDFGFDELISQMMTINTSLKVLESGDPLQLPPVNEVQSKGFLCPDVMEMTQPVRQNPGPLLDYITNLRDFLRGATQIFPIVPNKSENGSGIYLLDEKDFDKWMHAAVMNPDYEQESDLNYNQSDRPPYSKFISWTNRAVNENNQKIREWRYGDIAKKEPYIQGEKIISCSPVFLMDEYSNNETLLMNNEDEAIVVSSVVAQHPIHTHVECHRLELMPIEAPRNSDIALPIVCYCPTKRGMQIYQKQLSDMADQAKQQKAMWSSFHSFKQSFADIRTYHAITAHRSQGSTYRNAFIDLGDILRNPNKREAYQCLYVAISRASHNVMLKKP